MNIAQILCISSVKVILEDAASGCSRQSFCMEVYIEGKAPP